MKKIMRRILSMALAIIMVLSVSSLTKVESKAAKNKYDASYYAPVFDATYYYNHNPDLQAAIGNDGTKLLNHFVNSGMKEGRQGSEEFNVQAYMNRYADLKAAFGNDLKKYYMHYITSGKAEGRNGKAAGTTSASNSANANNTSSVPSPIWACNGAMDIFVWDGTKYVSPYTGKTLTYDQAWNGEYSYLTKLYTGTINANSNSGAPSNFDANYYAQVMFKQINEERAKVGQPALIWNDGLASAAQVRAQEVSTYWSHTRPDGSDCFTVSNAGANGLRGEYIHYGAAGSFFTSKQHIGGMNRASQKYVGVGVYQKGGLTYYCVWTSGNP